MPSLPLASWRSHRLLAPFARSTRGAHRLVVPLEDRPRWLSHLAALRTELRERRDGHTEAVRAHLALLLIYWGRLSTAVAHSSGQLSALMKRRTGHTIEEWITERRMREARRLLLDTNLTISEIAARLGYDDPGYFTRRFRAEHQLSPTAWRHPGR